MGTTRNVFPPHNEIIELQLGLNQPFLLPLKRVVPSFSLKMGHPLSSPSSLWGGIDDGGGGRKTVIKRVFMPVAFAPVAIQNR